MPLSTRILAISPISKPHELVTLHEISMRFTDFVPVLNRNEIPLVFLKSVHIPVLQQEYPRSPVVFPDPRAGKHRKDFALATAMMSAALMDKFKPATVIGFSPKALALYAIRNIIDRFLTIFLIKCNRNEIYHIIIYL